MHPSGGPSFGVINAGQEIHGLSHHAPDLRTFLAQTRWMEWARAALNARATARLGDVVLLPPVPNPDKILCVGLNYADHVAETGRAAMGAPTIFTRFADTLVGQDGAIVAPKNSSELDYEAELAVIIGRPCRHVTADKALDYVAGYSCFNDASARDWQYQTTQFTPGKNFPCTGGFGPWMVTADEIPNPQDLRLSLRLNGETLQDTTTDKMIFSVATVIAYISQFTTLGPGDVIATGTPAGVGSKRSPPIYLKPGDKVDVEISGIGVLKNRIAAET